MRAISFLDIVLCMLAAMLLIAYSAGTEVMSESQPSILILTVPSQSPPPRILLREEGEFGYPTELDMTNVDPNVFHEVPGHYPANLLRWQYRPDNDISEFWFVFGGSARKVIVEVQGVLQTNEHLVNQVRMARARLDGRGPLTPVAKWNDSVLELLENQGNIDDLTSRRLVDDEILRFRNAESLYKMGNALGQRTMGRDDWPGARLLAIVCGDVNEGILTAPDVRLQELMFAYILHVRITGNRQFPDADAVGSGLTAALNAVAADGDNLTKVMQAYSKSLYDNSLLVMDLRGIDGVASKSKDWTVLAPLKADASGQQSSTVQALTKIDPASISAQAQILEKTLSMNPAPRWIGWRYLDAVAAALQPKAGTAIVVSAGNCTVMSSEYQENHDKKQYRRTFRVSD